uniref:Tribbles pseudokinase 3 n=1 Tax=Panthera tigris altaica TaxID=74533 RepID=A0A8C9JRI1_PANTA
MRATPLAAAVGAPSRRKRWELDNDLNTECPIRKQARIGPQPRLPSCPLPPSPLPAPAHACAGTTASRLGPYVLLEPEEGGRAYWALHCPSGTEYTCKVQPRAHFPTPSPHSPLPPSLPCPTPAELILGCGSNTFLPQGPCTAHMAAALAHCHQHGLVLRDLKLRRFVFTKKERTKLVLENLEDACVLNGPDDSLWDKHACPAYVGPEILSSRASYSGKAADVWSLGVALFTMLAGHYPFQDSEPALLFGKIRRGAFALPEGLSAPARCLVRCLLRREPAERLTATGILLHPWLREKPIPSAPPRSHLWEADQVVPEGPGLEEAEEEEGVREAGLYG